MDELGKRLARGDRDAMAELYDLCADRVHRYLTLRLGAADLADETLQETFVRLVRHRRKLARAENLMAYVFAVARNESARLQRRSRRRKDRAWGRAGDDTSSRPMSSQAIRDDRPRREQRDLIAAGLDQLTPDRREIVELKIYAGLTLAEIAELTETPPGTVATRYRAALVELRKFFGAQLS